MNFDEMDRGLEAALKTGLKSHLGASTARNVAPSALSEAGETLKQANAIAARIMDMADRLCGPISEATNNSGVEATPSGDLGRLRADMRDTRQAMIFADAALTRIEQELIG